MHRHCRVYRLTAAVRSRRGAASARPASLRWVSARSAVPAPGRRRSHRAAGGRRSVTAADRGLLIDLLVAFGIEAGGADRLASDLADDLISYGGAVCGRCRSEPRRIKEAAHTCVSPQHRDAARSRRSPPYQPVAMAAVTRPVAGTVRINIVYTLPERRRSGHAAAVTLDVSRAVLAGDGAGQRDRAARRPRS